MKKMLFSALALATSMAVVAQAFTPALKVTIGKKYEAVTTIQGSMNQEAMGQSIEIPYDSRMENIILITATDKNGSAASATLNKMRASINMMGQEMGYDSEKGDNAGPLADQFSPYIGKTTTFKLDVAGNVVPGSVVAPEVTKTEGTDGDMMASLAKSIFGQIVGIVPPVFDLLPPDAKNMSIGQSVTRNKEEGTQFRSNMVYVLTEIKDGKARFSLTGMMVMETKNEIQGMTMSSTSSNKETGEMWVDIATGMLISQKTTIETTGTAEVMGTQMPIKGTTTRATVVKAL
jgi:hypothetical protein